MSDEPVPPKELPLYRVIAQTLRTEIEAGQHGDPKVGLPGADALAARFNTSAATTREALKLLERDRVIEIRRGVGAFVRRRKPIVRHANARLSRQHWGQGTAIWEVDLGDRYPVPETTVWRSTDPDAPEVPAYVRGQLSAEVYTIRDRRFTVDGAPVELAASYLDHAVAGGTQIERVDTGPGGTWARLAELGYDVARADEWFMVRDPSPEEAKRLKITDKPVVEIARVAKTAAGVVVEVTVMVLIADEFVFHNEITT